MSSKSNFPVNQALLFFLLEEEGSYWVSWKAFRDLVSYFNCPLPHNVKQKDPASEKKYQIYFNINLPLNVGIAHSHEVLHYITFLILQIVDCT
jgi:hypothetical protein